MSCSFQPLKVVFFSATGKPFTHLTRHPASVPTLLRAGVSLW
jgi:hypothetical protein